MADEMQAPPPAPDGLGERGLRLWSDTVRDLELDPDETVLLEEACRLTDEVDVLTAALDAGGLMVKGSRGQQVANPLIRELRQHRLALARVLRQLGATNPGEDTGERSTPSQRGRKAALARWHGPRGEAAVLRPQWGRGDAS
ncbi:hypothetical protein [Streptomyces asiaticus]|uniref:hypothetical protein n=1 Tax=Streptomyces asiaticus TaxID=114695 RepID=UPI0037F220A2